MKLDSHRNSHQFHRNCIFDEFWTISMKKSSKFENIDIFFVSTVSKLFSLIHIFFCSDRNDGFLNNRNSELSPEKIIENAKNDFCM